jgi:predicted transcriptional regulator
VATVAAKTGPLERLRERLALRKLPDPAELRRIRMAAGLTQGELAIELGVAPLSVARYESGARHPRGELAERYGRLLRLLRESADA